VPETVIRGTEQFSRENKKEKNRQRELASTIKGKTASLTNSSLYRMGVETRGLRKEEE